MLKAIIIDDEKDAIDVLSMQLEQFCAEEIRIVALCEGGAMGIKAIKQYKPDLVFLDIEMPHVNGFEVLTATVEEGYKVVFTTAYDQFAIKAFKYAAVDYLLKPIDISELKVAVQKVLRLNEKYQLEAKLNLLVQKMQMPPQRIALPVENGIELVLPSEIVRCESDSNYTALYLRNGKKIVTAKTLKDVEENLTGFSFFRIHQSHLINTEHIIKVVKGEGGYVVMSDNTNLPVSKAKRESFMEIFRKI